MTTIALAIVILLELLTWFVIFDVILSWLQFIGIKRPKFVGSVLDPMYTGIKRYIPTTIGPFELTPIILIIFFMFIKGAIFLIIPDVVLEVQKLSNY